MHQYTGVACPEMKKVRGCSNTCSYECSALAYLPAASRSREHWADVALVAHPLAEHGVPTRRPVPLRTQRVRVLAAPQQVGMVSCHVGLYPDQRAQTRKHVIEAFVKLQQA